MFRISTPVRGISHPNILAALGLAALLFAIEIGQDPGYLASALGALPAPQAEEGSYYKNAYTIIDLPFGELLADFPELKGLEPAASQQELPTILSKVGVTVEQLYQNLPSVAAEERITQEQCDDDGRARSTTQHDFNYLITVNHDGPVESLQEYRTDARMRPVDSMGVGEGFNFTKDFASLWLLFYPVNQSLVNFRYLGVLVSFEVRERSHSRESGNPLCKFLEILHRANRFPLRGNDCASRVVFESK